MLKVEELVDCVMHLVRNATNGWHGDSVRKPEGSLVNHGELQRQCFDS